MSSLPKQFTKQEDGSWRMTGTSEGEVRLESIGCTPAFADIYNKVTSEPPVRLVIEGPR